MFRTLLSIFLVLLGTIVHAQGSSVLSARLASLDAATALDDGSLKPWSMVVHFRLLDKDGRATDEGTIEELWAGPTRMRRSVKSTGYTSVYVRNDHGEFRTAGTSELPYALQVVERQMVHPMPRPEEVSGLRPQMVKLALETGPMDCIMLQPAKDVEPFQHIGVFPTYCTKQGQDLLVASYDYSTLAVSRVALGVFQKRIIATELNVTLNRVKVAEAHLVSLKTVVPTEADFTPEAGNPEIHESEVVWKNGMPYPERTYAPTVYAPPGILTAHSYTTPVVINIRIGTDGVVRSLRLVSTPDFRMTDVALEGVSRWRFKPYLVKGEAVSIDFPAYFLASEVPGIHIVVR